MAQIPRTEVHNQIQHTGCFSTVLEYFYILKKLQKNKTKNSQKAQTEKNAADILHGSQSFTIRSLVFYRKCLLSPAPLRPFSPGLIGH